MKQHLTCPKCKGRRIWVIEKYRIPGETAEGRVLPIVPHQNEVATPRLFSFGRANPIGHVDLYLCDGCGYSELWAEGVRGLVHDPANGVRLVDSAVAGEGPF